MNKFGYEAETKYADLAADGEHHKYYFYKRFKMKLFGKVVSLLLCINAHIGISLNYFIFLFL